MNPFIKTERLLLRPLNINDAESLFVLDSDPLVMRYLGNKTIQSVEEVQQYLKNILDQYQENGIGRWAVIEPESNELMGWAGIKFIKEETNRHDHFYDLGYRLRPKYWGRGYATEATLAWIDYAKQQLNINSLYATTHIGNFDSQRVLGKCGFIQKETFQFTLNEEILDCFWFELKW